MSFVPVVPYVPPPPSRRARELGEKIRATIDEYQREQPGTTSTEIRQALRLAASGSDCGKAAGVIAALLGVLVLLGFVFLKRGGGLETVPWTMVVLVAILVLGVAAVAVGLKRR
jgi:hypothetical protein